MYNKIKALLMLSFALSFSFANATSTGTTASTGAASTFSMTDVSVVDASTLKVSFSNDLLDDATMFEFLLTPKSDNTVEIALTGATLSWPKELTINTVEPLTLGQDYDMVVVFASDKEGNVIENGVDGMVTVSVPADLSTPAVTDWAMNAASTETPVVDETASETTMDSAATEDSWVSTEVAATTAEALPKTGPAEMMIVVLAMAIALGFMYVRRRA